MRTWQNNSSLTKKRRGMRVGVGDAGVGADDVTWLRVERGEGLNNKQLTVKSREAIQPLLVFCYKYFNRHKSLIKVLFIQTEKYYSSTSFIFKNTNYKVIVSFRSYREHTIQNSCYIQIHYKPGVTMDTKTTSLSTLS